MFGKESDGNVVRKILRGVNRYRVSLGHTAFEDCCRATLARTVPSFTVLEQEIEIWLQGDHHQPTPLCEATLRLDITS